jgi:hypothetical protein
MTPGNTFSHPKRVLLGAHISIFGNPMAKRGDLEGNFPVLKVGVKILIDQPRL